jgi:hypothetical protein
MERDIFDLGWEYTDAFGQVSEPKFPGYSEAVTGRGYDSQGAWESIIGQIATYYGSGILAQLSLPAQCPAPYAKAPGRQPKGYEQFYTIAVAWGSTTDEEVRV